MLRLTDGPCRIPTYLFVPHIFVLESLSNLRSITLVQQNCIPQALLGGDIICQAKSGLGKTAVFVLTTLQQVEPVAGECSVLVMCHTRELAYQIKNSKKATLDVQYPGVSLPPFLLFFLSPSTFSHFFISMFYFLLYVFFFPLLSYFALCA